MVSSGGAIAMPVMQCNTVNRNGMFIPEQLHDVTTRGWGCAQGIRHARRVARTWHGQRHVFRSGRLRCYRLYEEQGHATIRCWSRSLRAVRFTLPATRTSRNALAVQCGAFRTYFDIAVRGLSCMDASDLIRASAHQWMHPRIGRIMHAHVGFVCSLIYIEGDQPTYRCRDAHGRSFRFARSSEPVGGVLAFGRPVLRHHQHAQRPTLHGKLLVSNTARTADRAGAWLADPARSDRPVAPEVLSQCPPINSHRHVVTLGIACDQLERLIAAAPRAERTAQTIEGLRCSRRARFMECASSSGYQGFSYVINRND